MSHSVTAMPVEPLKGVRRRHPVTTPNTPPLANSMNDTCRRLGVGRTTIYKLIAAGEIRTFKVGRKTLIAESELQRYIGEKTGNLLDTGAA